MNNKYVITNKAGQFASMAMSGAPGPTRDRFGKKVTPHAQWVSGHDSASKWTNRETAEQIMKAIAKDTVDDVIALIENYGTTEQRNVARIWKLA